MQCDQGSDIPSFTRHYIVLNQCKIRAKPCQTRDGENKLININLQPWLQRQLRVTDTRYIHTREFTAFEISDNGK
ncbi:hypothetical protein EYC80_005003 [Monilinia laxa]|uniref:Uncharacterized protein n=1 Tax=Monilinia laxa TaxID=61186 RepID=A0A5N6KIK9_MONLA|nr:hypothetical protein EYC80_005003 [Monilinia laxa]